MLYKIQTTAHKMKNTLFPVIFMVILGSYYCENTGHSAYVATATESDGAKIDGLLPPNFL